MCNRTNNNNNNISDKTIKKNSIYYRYYFVKLVKKYGLQYNTANKKYIK